MLTRNKNENSGIFSLGAILNGIAEFNYIPEEEITFSSYLSRYETFTKQTVPIDLTTKI